MDIMTQMMLLYQATSKSYQRLLERLARECSLSPAELSVLLFLEREEADTASEIVQKQGMSKASVSKAVETLEDRAYIRARQDAKDRRIVHLSITQKARPVVQLAADRQDELLKELCRGISEEDCRQMQEVFHTIHINISREEKRN